MAEHGPHCETCTCGCTCGYGGQHEPDKETCELNLRQALAERRADPEFLARVNESVRINRRLLDRLADEGGNPADEGVAVGLSQRSFTRRVFSVLASTSHKWSARIAAGRTFAIRSRSDRSA